MFKHCCMPQSMTYSVIVPLVKNKSGRLADNNNYRLIELSSIASKVFEHVIRPFCCASHLPMCCVILHELRCAHLQAFASSQNLQL